jgi:hypothetical protein
MKAARASVFLDASFIDGSDKLAPYMLGIAAQPSRLDDHFIADGNALIISFSSICRYCRSRRLACARMIDP